MAENVADAIRHGIDAAKRMVAANSRSVVKRVTIPAHTMAVPAAAVAIARVTGRIWRLILSLVSQDFMAFFRSLFLIGLTGFTAVGGWARDNKRTRGRRRVLFSSKGLSPAASLAAIHRRAEIYPVGGLGELRLPRRPSTSRA